MKIISGGQAGVDRAALDLAIELGIEWGGWCPKGGDGHIVLNRQLAEAGHYPAIDIEQSISRAMHGITSDDHQKLARRLKKLTASYQRSRDLIRVGAYSAGSDPVIDEAIARQARIEAFLQQDITEQAGLEESLGQLTALFQ